MGVHLRRTDENVREIDALGTLLGGAVGVDAVLADLNRKASRTFVLGRGRLGQGGRLGLRLGPRGPRRRALVAAGRVHLGRRLRHRGHRRQARARRQLVRQGRAAASGSPSWTWPACATATCCSSCRSSTSTGCSCCDRCACTPEAWSGTARTCTWPPRPAAWSPAASTTSCACPDVRGTGAYRLGLRGQQVASYGYRYVLPVRFSYRAYADDGNDPLQVLLPLARPQHRAPGDRRGRVRADRAEHPAGALPPRAGHPDAADRRRRAVAADRARRRRHLPDAGGLDRRRAGTT